MKKYVNHDDEDEDRNQTIPLRIENLTIDPKLGDDQNPGTRELPIRTWAEAMRRQPPDVTNMRAELVFSDGRRAWVETNAVGPPWSVARPLRPLK